MAVTVDEARELMLDVGLEDAVEEFDDDLEAATATREALLEGCSKLADEIRVSLEFYSAQEGASPVQHVVICGPGGTIPGLPEQIQTGAGPTDRADEPARSLAPRRRGRGAVDGGLRPRPGGLRRCAPST